jgi:glutaredoxin 3
MGAKIRVKPMTSITIYTTPFCGYCHSAKRLLAQKRVEFTEIDVSGDPAQRQVMVARAGGRRTVPQIFIGDRHVGGCDDLYRLDAKGELDELLAGQGEATGV